MTTPSTSSTDSGPQRLQKVMARAGVASRRACEELITAGRVTVNGEVASTLGVKVDTDVDVIAVDGVAVRTGLKHVYFALNKPAGFLTTLNDPQGRPTIAGFLPRKPPGIFPVGRLDRDTEGLLLLTNDGELAFRLLHPRYHVSKEYRAVVAGKPKDEALRRLREGIELDDGMTAPAEVAVLGRGGGTSLLGITLLEGRKRQVRRMVAAVGHPVVTLKRVRFGPVVLGDQEAGTVRPLTDAEVRALKGESGDA